MFNMVVSISITGLVVGSLEDPYWGEGYIRGSCGGGYKLNATVWLASKHALNTYLHTPVPRRHFVQESQFLSCALLAKEKIV